MEVQQYYRSEYPSDRPLFFNQKRIIQTVHDNTKIGIAIGLYLAVIAGGIPGNDFAAIGIGAAGGLVLAISVLLEVS